MLYLHVGGLSPHWGGGPEGKEGGKGGSTSNEEDTKEDNNFAEGDFTCRKSVDLHL